MADEDSSLLFIDRSSGDARRTARLFWEFIQDDKSAKGRVIVLRIQDLKSGSMTEMRSAPLFCEKEKGDLMARWGDSMAVVLPADLHDVTEMRQVSLQYWLSERPNEITCLIRPSKDEVNIDCARGDEKIGFVFRRGYGLIEFDFSGARFRLINQGIIQ